jgi:lipase chaperone LimK
MPRLAALLASLALSAGCYVGADGDQALQPRSLAGTEVDGALRVASGGEFVLDARAQEAFDYFLSADGELGPAELDAWVHAEFARQLPDHAEEAFAAWQTYRDYRADAAATLANRELDLAALESRLLGSVTRLGDAPLAGSERALITRAFAIQRATALTGAAREAALAELAAETPGEARTLVARLREIETAQLVGAGELHALRTQQFGGEAAQRLAELDARRARWDARVAAFRGARDALRAGFEGAPAELEAALSALAAEHFSPAEARRVRALDRLAGPVHDPSLAAAR